MISVAPDPVMMLTRFFSRAIACTESPMAEFDRPVTICTSCWSNQPRTSVDATSGLLWPSPVSNSMRRPITSGPKSSTAICAATTAPRPYTEAMEVLRSSVMPIRNGGACATAPAANTIPNATANTDANTRFIVSASFPVAVLAPPGPPPGRAMSLSGPTRPPPWPPSLPARH